MLTRNICRVLLLALLSPTASLALGLGDIHLKSTLNAPLDADIDVVGASADELSGLKATLASRETFNRYRLEYPAFLAGVTFEPKQTADGRTVLHMHSADAVNEPIATLLVEVNWARGHLVREYTVLLDPPVFSGDSTNSGAAAVAAPVTAEGARSGSVERRVANAAPAAAPPVAAPSTSSPAASPSRARSASANASTYTVRSGDTLTAITSQVYGAGDHVARQRELVAVYRANTSAFDGNMNIMRSGSRLTMPGESELMAISPGEAAAEVHRQYSAWNGTHAAAAAAGGSSGAGQLRLVPPQESAPAAAKTAPAAAASNAPSAPASGNAAAAAAANAAASAALQQRVTQLESQLADSQRLLQMKNSELAALQARPALVPAAPAPAAPTAPPPSAAAPAPAPAPPTAAPPATPPSAEAPAPATTKPKPAPAAAATPAGNSFVDLLVQYWYVPAALVVILIVLLVLRAVRARQEDAFDRSLGRLSTTGFESQPVAEPPRTADTVPVRALAPSRDEQAYRVEESGAHEQPPGAAAALADTAASGRHVAIDDNVPTEAPVALDQGDPLAEADFHMAYGLYDQAADLVQIAISREPDRRDLRLKLLEVFFVWGNKDRFMQAARELAATREKALPGEWEKIVIMGRQIAPEDPLFAASGALSGAASGGVDLNLEGGQNRIDFDLMGEPTVSAPPSAGRTSAVDLDLGAALGDKAVSDGDPTGESRPVSESGVDFVFDDADRGNEQTGSTREMPSRSGQATTMTAAVASDPDAPTVEQPQLADGDNPTIRQKIDAAKRGGAVSSEQTAELELHDLGLDLGSMDTGGDETEIAPSADASTMLAGTGEETRQLLHQADTELGKDDKAPAPGEPTDSGTWLFTDTDFVDVATTPGAGRVDAPTEIVTQLVQRPEFEPPHDSSSTARLAALESPAGLDHDLGDLDKTQIKELGDSNGVDLDVGTPASSSEGTFVQTQRIMAEDIPLPDLEPATMSEVGTKLDLARAYMDMGDPEGARSILSEVLSEGSLSQKQEARRLIDTLPG